MISKDQIMGIIQQQVEDENYFVVDVEVKPLNKIIVHLDGDQGVPIEFCVSISRLIEHTLDRESEDFELEVSSPGIGQPFKVHRQFTKNIGRHVEVIGKDGMKHSGELFSVSQEGFVIKEERMVRPEGKKKKVLQVSEHPFIFEEVKSVKEIIKF
jgi:ribosome maturation factor RimP